MIKISEVLIEILNSNPYLDYGLFHGLFAVSKVAEMIKPAVETRTKKKVSQKSLEMALLRFKQSQKSLKLNTEYPDFKLEKISVTNGLIVETFEKNANTHKTLQKFYELIANKNGFYTTTESLEQITIVYEEKYKIELQKMTSIKPKSSYTKTCALYAQFGAEYLEFPGMLHHILHTLLTQGINMLEVASTWTSFVIFLKEEDVKLAFNTLHDRMFSRT